MEGGVQSRGWVRWKGVGKRKKERRRKTRRTVDELSLAIVLVFHQVVVKVLVLFEVSAAQHL